MKGNIMDIETLIMTSLSLDTLRSGDNIFKSVLMLALMYGVKQIGSFSKVATEHVKKWCEKRVEEKMETVIKLNVPVEVHIAVGKNWAEC